MTQTATPIDLQIFCSTDNAAFGLPMRHPWNAGGWRYACDGMVCVRVPTTEPDSVPSDGAPAFPKAESLFTAKGIDFSKCTEPWPEGGFIQQKDDCPDCAGSGNVGGKECSECGGSGEVECPTCGNEDRCDECDGEGYIVPAGAGECPHCEGRGERMVDKFLWVGAHFMRGENAKRVATLPGVRWQPGREPNRPLPFVFEGGQGLLMPIYPDSIPPDHRREAR